MAHPDNPQDKLSKLDGDFTVTDEDIIKDDTDGAGDLSTESEDTKGDKTEGKGVLQEDDAKGGEGDTKGDTGGSGKPDWLIGEPTKEETPFDLAAFAKEKGFIDAPEYKQIEAQVAALSTRVEQIREYEQTVLTTAEAIENEMAEVLAPYGLDTSIFKARNWPQLFMQKVDAFHAKKHAGTKETSTQDDDDEPLTRAELKKILAENKSPTTDPRVDKLLQEKDTREEIEAATTRVNQAFEYYFDKDPTLRALAAKNPLIKDIARDSLGNNYKALLGKGDAMPIFNAIKKIGDAQRLIIQTARELDGHAPKPTTRTTPISGSKATTTERKQVAKPSLYTEKGVKRSAIDALEDFDEEFNKSLGMD